MSLFDSFLNPFGLLGGDSPATPPRNTVSGTLSDVTNALPGYYDARSEWDPQFQSLQMQLLQNGLLGGNGQQGSLSLLQQARGSELQNLMGLAPQMAATMRGANPQQWAMLDQLNSSATGDLALGGELNPDQMRRMQQTSRMASQARGLSGSNMSIADEMFRQYDLSRELENERRKYALSVGGLNQQASLNPFAMQGLGNTAMGMAGGLTGSNPMDSLFQYAQDNAMTDYNARASANIAQANNQAGLFGGLLEAGGAMGGAAILACWVAREVFGAHDQRWLQFRSWLMTAAPGWFRKLYLRHGERFAAWLHRHPALKPIIRRWMEGRIANHQTRMEEPYAV